MTAGQLRPRGGLEVCRIDDDVLLFDGTQLQLLSGSAADVWLRIDGAASASVISARVAAAALPQDPSARDAVRTFVEELLDRGLVEAVGAAATTAYARRPHAGWVRDGDTVLLVDLKDGRRRALPGTAGRTWELACAGASADDVVHALRAEYPDAPASADDDVRALLDLLVADGWLVRYDAGEPPSSR